MSVGRRLATISLRVATVDPASPFDADGASRSTFPSRSDTREGEKVDSSTRPPSPSETNGAVQGDDGLARPRRADDPCRAGEVTIRKLALRGVEEDRPLVPRSVERRRELRLVPDETETALGVGVVEASSGFHHHLERDRRPRRTRHAGRLRRPPQAGERRHRAPCRRSRSTHPRPSPPARPRTAPPRRRSSPGRAAARRLRRGGRRRPRPAHSSSTICMAPVRGCASIRRRSAQA